MDTKVAKPAARRTRRTHAPEFKAQVIEACLQPGVSVAGVALANGLNTNYLRRWVKEHREQIGEGPVNGVVAVSRHVKPTALVPVTIEAPVARESGKSGSTFVAARRSCRWPGPRPTSHCSVAY